MPFICKVNNEDVGLIDHQRFEFIEINTFNIIIQDDFESRQIALFSGIFKKTLKKLKKIEFFSPNTTAFWKNASRNSSIFFFFRR
jgi:hypothetical protein